MAVRSVTNQSKRGIEIVMTREDDAALTKLLRERFSPLEIVAVSFATGELEALECISDAPRYFEVYILNPDPGESFLNRLRMTLRFCDSSHTDIFRAALPRRQALYLNSHGLAHSAIKLGERDQRIELFHFGSFHFIYNRNDVEARRFTGKMMRLLTKFLVNRFAVVVAETGEAIRERKSSRWVGPGALESCRQHPHRYIMGAGHSKRRPLFLAPLPPERYEELKRRGRKAKR